MLSCQFHEAKRTSVNIIHSYSSLTEPDHLYISLCIKVCDLQWYFKANSKTFFHFQSPYGGIQVDLMMIFQEEICSSWCFCFLSILCFFYIIFVVQCCMKRIDFWLTVETIINRFLWCMRHVSAFVIQPVWPSGQKLQDGRFLTYNLQ